MSPGGRRGPHRTQRRAFAREPEPVSAAESRGVTDAALRCAARPSLCHPTPLSLSLSTVNTLLLTRCKFSPRVHLISATSLAGPSPVAGCSTIGVAARRANR